MLSSRSVLLLAAALAAAGCGSDAASTRAGADGRDLTLVSTPSTDAVLGPAEFVTPPAAPNAPAVSAAPAARPRVVRKPAVAAAPDLAPTLQAPAPLAAAEPAPATPEPVADTWAGAGTALEPGQAVGVVPVAIGAGSRMPPTELVTERGIRWTGMIHGDDRCIPGRDEMLPGFRARRH
ncbi:MAG TPA: hypothetical protein VHJ69_09485 [Gemmatimonadales bacterium]|jgi:hypothetical protein|nr:hypothetical protein [Gemmatimonadales bacterium]